MAGKLEQETALQRKEKCGRGKKNIGVIKDKINWNLFKFHWHRVRDRNLRFQGATHCYRIRKCILEFPPPLLSSGNATRQMGQNKGNQILSKSEKPIQLRPQFGNTTGPPENLPPWVDPPHLNSLSKANPTYSRLLLRKFLSKVSFLTI